jgi:hypothetical protein
MHRFGLLKYLKKVFEEASGLEFVTQVASDQILLSPKNSDEVIMVNLKDLQVVSVHSGLPSPIIFTLDISDHTKTLQAVKAMFSIMFEDK